MCLSLVYVAESSRSDPVESRSQSSIKFTGSADGGKNGAWRAGGNPSGRGFVGNLVLDKDCSECSSFGVEGGRIDGVFRASPR